MTWKFWLCVFIVFLVIGGVACVKAVAKANAKREAEAEAEREARRVRMAEEAKNPPPPPPSRPLNLDSAWPPGHRPRGSARNLTEEELERILRGS